VGLIWLESGRSGGGELVGRELMLGRENALEAEKLGRRWGNNWSIGGSFANMDHFHTILQNSLGILSVDQL
jgi:hypothetical protein